MLNLFTMAQEVKRKAQIGKKPYRRHEAVHFSQITTYASSGALFGISGQNVYRHCSVAWLDYFGADNLCQEPCF